MKNLIMDFINFIKSLSLLDVLFIVALIGLVALVVTLIYIIKVNKEENLEFLEDNDEAVEEDNGEDEELDLASISKKIEESPTRPITLNDYEREQEEKAIISYDELVKTKEIPVEEINYKNEEDIGGLTIKTVDQDEITKPIELPKIKLKESKIEEEVKVENNNDKVLISYDKEEEFLQTLKQLESLLN